MVTEPPQAGLQGPGPALDVTGAKAVERHKALWAIVLDTGMELHQGAGWPLARDKQLWSMVPSQVGVALSSCMAWSLTGMGWRSCAPRRWQCWPGMPRSPLLPAG